MDKQDVDLRNISMPDKTIIEYPQYIIVLVFYYNVEVIQWYKTSLVIMYRKASLHFLPLRAYVMKKPKKKRPHVLRCCCWEIVTSYLHKCSVDLSWTMDAKDSAKDRT